MFEAILFIGIFVWLICVFIRSQDEQSRKLNQPLNHETALATIREWASNPSILYLDVETTGLENPEIIEIAIINGNGEVLINQRIKPRSNISRTASEVHGIYKRDLAECPQWPDVYPKIKSCLEHKQVVTYNAEFEGKAIEATCQIHNTPIFTVSLRCAMKAYAAYKQEPSPYYKDQYKWHKLEAALKQEGLNPTLNDHTALSDVKAVRTLLTKISQK